jgi:lysophospholipase L1-like esterase
MCTSRNRPLRLPEAIREGAVRIVSIGDSVSAMGSDTLFCQRLADRISEMAPATCTNLAEDGATTWDWLPGSPRGYMENRLLPVLPETDVLTVTLGANDLYWYLGDGPPYDSEEILQRVIDYPEYLENFIPNTIRVMEEVRARNPACDIVYVIYWNVVNSDLMAGVLGELAGLATFVTGSGLDILRTLTADVEGIVLADVDGALGNTKIDPYLYDEAHPNDAGHQLHADEVFRALGGVVLEAGSAENRAYGFYAPARVP